GLNTIYLHDRGLYSEKRPPSSCSILYAEIFLPSASSTASYRSSCAIISSRVVASSASVTPMASARWRSRDMATRLSCSVVGMAKAEDRVCFGGCGGLAEGTSGTKGTTLTSLGARRLIWACEQRTLSVPTVQPIRAAMASAFKPCWTSTGMPAITSLVRIKRRRSFLSGTEFIASALIMPLSPSARTRLKSCGAAVVACQRLRQWQSTHKIVFVIVIAV